MLDLKNLYQEVVVDHNRNPRNFGRIDKPTHTAEGYNQFCGDKLNLYLEIENNTISKIKFDGDGCAISIASASLMTDSIKNKTIGQAKQLFQYFHDLVISVQCDSDTMEDRQETLGKLLTLRGVSQYPARVKCATLCWHTLQSALAGDKNTVTTE